LFSDFTCKRNSEILEDDDFFTTVEGCAAGRLTETIQEYSTGISAYSRDTGTCVGTDERKVFRTGSFNQNCPLVSNYFFNSPRIQNFL